MLLCKWASFVCSTICYYLLFLAIIFLVLIISACSRYNELNWNQVKLEIKSAYPSVPHITIDELYRRFSTMENILLIDAREPEEYAISHLKDAKQYSQKLEVATLIKSDGSRALVVVYCSVGYRSAELALGLIEDGFTNVVNLEGSIFEWVNAGFPVYRGTQIVNTIHTYNRKWASLLSIEFQENRKKKSIDFVRR